PGAAPLRGRGPRARACAAGGRLPAVPRPAAGRRPALRRPRAARQVAGRAAAGLARAVRFRYFEAPVVQENRQVVLEAAAGLLAELEDAGARGDSDEAMRRVEALVESPEPLIRLLAQRAEAEPSVPDPVLEVLTRRYYRSRDLQNVRASLLVGHSAVIADYDLRGTRLHLLAWMGPMSALPAAIDEAARLSADVAEESSRLLDLYVAWPDRPDDVDAVTARLQEMLAPLAPVPAMRRITVTVCTPDGNVETVTFRRRPEGLVEDRLIRGMHPLTAQRLNLWRLKEFVGDPTVERQLTACLDSLRRAQSRRRSRRPLEHNRVFLYAWPSIEVGLSEVATFAHMVAPLTVGAGLDQIMLFARLVETPGGPPREIALRFSYRPGTGLRLQVTERPTEPMRALDPYTEKVLSSRAR